LTGPKFRVLTPDAQYADDGKIERATAGEGFQFLICREHSAEALPAGVLESSDALLVWHLLSIDAALITRLRACRVIVRAGVGYDHIDVAAAGAVGIPVCNTPDYGTSEVADHAIALMLALKRGIVSYQDAMRADPHGGYHWSRAPVVDRIRGTTFGVVGLGRIGTAAALRARAFGFEILVYDPYLPRGQEIALGVGRVGSLAELLGASDVVSLHAPLTPETRNMIDDEAFAAMRPHTILINTARGGMVDLDALQRALHDKSIAAAALDVLPEEPPDPTHPLLTAYAGGADWLRGRLLITPHAAWYSPDSQADARRLAVETLVAYLRDGRLQNSVNDAYLVNRRALNGAPSP
jgi:D-3-phosphoglycerate dehydrogenase